MNIKRRSSKGLNSGHRGIHEEKERKDSPNYYARRRLLWSIIPAFISRSLTLYTGSCRAQEFDRDDC
jgi:hypothetical protein